MPDDTTDPRDARDPNHIWLRQSITFSVNGQTRTLELALPLRPGATPEEVDALLDEADAGMRRLSQRLDAHLAEISNAPAPAPAIAPAPPAHPATQAPQRPAARPAPAASQPPASRVNAPAAPASQLATEERPAPPPSAQPARSIAPAAAAASAGPDLTRPEFLAAVASLGLDARTVMERLNVRSLNGLNLRETLDLLRRQALREGSAEPEPAAPAAPQPATMSAAMSPTPEDMPTPIGVARFDEEDDGPDFELSYPDPDDLPSDNEEADFEDFAPQEIGSGAPLSDVPDLDDLLAPAPATPAKPAPAAASAPAPEPAAESAPTAASDSGPEQDNADARARERIASLRAAHPGGQPSAQQQKAYRNIVVEELGEKKATSIIRALWDVTSDKLGPEQYDELIRWGKQDTFADEVEEVLGVLRAEWLAQHGGAPSAKPTAPTRQPAPSAAPKADQPQTQAPARPAARSRSTTRANSDAAGSQGGV